MYVPILAERCTKLPSCLGQAELLPCAGQGPAQNRLAPDNAADRAPVEPQQPSRRADPYLGGDCTDGRQGCGVIIIDRHRGPLWAPKLGRRVRVWRYLILASPLRCRVSALDR